MSEPLHEKLSQVSSQPGVYMMKNAKGEIIYVGKARNLKKRLSSYFLNSAPSDLKTSILVKKISTFETIITPTENEALILESNLIKQYKPRYNVILKDDKRYPLLRLDIKEPYPYLSVGRKIENDGALYFGPFSSPRAVHQTLRIIHKTFRIRKCKKPLFPLNSSTKNKSRPCLNYQMGVCLGPCSFEVNQATYHEIIKEIILFLKGKTPDLIQKIKNNMMAAANVQDYETAAILRDRLFALEKILEKQVSITADLKDRDIIAIAREPLLSNPQPGNEKDPETEQIVLTIFFVRSGYLVGMRHFEFMETFSTDQEIIRTFIRQYYEKSHFVPDEILVSASLEDTFLIETWLRTIKKGNIRIIYPQKGEKARLLKMAVQNATEKCKTLAASSASKHDMLIRLQQHLKIKRFPKRIECFDNSNISGRSPVAGMVVFENGKPCKSAYRRYKIRTVEEQNDYAYMAEVLNRRYGKGEKSEPLPDILMLDGGKGQLNIAVSVIKELGLEGAFEIISIAKKDEKRGGTDDKIYKPKRANPINFSREKDLLFFLQQIRDESHRYAISFHRKVREKKAVHSVLDTVPGVGKKRKARLLKHFGSVKNIRQANIEEISALPGINHSLAEAIKKHLT